MGGKTGKFSKIAGRHGREGYPQWKKDQKNLKRRSVETGLKWILVPSEPVGLDLDEGEDLTSIEAASVTFKSDVTKLRPHPAESWGYRIVRCLTANDALIGVKPERLGPGRPSKRDVAGRALVIGEPAIDAGASAMVRPPDGDTSISEDQLTEDGDPFVELLNKAAAILATYDFLDRKTVIRKVAEDEDTRRERYKLNRKLPKGEKIQRKKETVEVIYVIERKPEAKGAVTNLQRRTVDVSPGLSRSVQRMIEAGLVNEAREILDNLVVPLCREFEMVFPGSKAVAGGWHVRSGQLHLDMWVHGTWLEVVKEKSHRAPTTVRLWDPDILHHFGPGPGVCAWDRHVSALGDEAETYCPGIVAEVAKALEEKQERAIGRDAESRGAGQANRDVAIHRRFDEIVSAALPDEFVEIGMNEYREHLKAIYRNLGDPKVTSAIKEAAEPSIAARFEEAEQTRLAAKADREQAALELAAAQSARDTAANELAAAELSKARAVVREQKIQAREESAETAVSRAKSVLAGKVRKLRSKIRATTARREQTVADRESQLDGARVSLGRKIRSMRLKIRAGVADQVTKALSGLAALVLGKDRANALLKSNTDPREAIQKEVAGLRLAEDTLAEIVATIKLKNPQPEHAKLFAKAAVVLQANIAARGKRAPEPEVKKGEDERKR
jgi:hypothetical protein